MICRHLVALLAVLGAASAAAVAEQPLDLTSSIGRFSVNLFGAIANGRPDSSYILSPLSVLTDLSMARLGACGQTARELDAGLQLGAGRHTAPQIAAAFRSFLQPLQSAQSALHVVNKIYVNDQFTVKPQFNALVAGNFFATADALDFGQPSRAAAVINDYVASQTNQLIRNLVDAGQLSADTRMLLINAVYFKAAWLHPFEKWRTRKETFHLQSGGADAGRQVDFMHATNRYRYAELPDLNAIVVGLPYKTGGYVMNVVLPNVEHGGGLVQLQNDLIGADLSKLSAGMQLRRIDLSMPKFESRYKLSLNGALKKVRVISNSDSVLFICYVGHFQLGIRTAFTGVADFSQLLERAPNVAISDVVHEAYIKVDENGTEAAAATGTYDICLNVDNSIDCVFSCGNKCKEFASAIEF